MLPPRAVVLVEGESDRVALTTLALRQGRDLAAQRVEVVAMGGVTNIRAHAQRNGPQGLGLPLLGLYDAPAEAHVRRGLAAAGLSGAGTAGSLTALGFHACTADLEDELIRALGVPRVEAVIDAAGETRSLARLAGMPVQRDWTRDAVLRRFLTSQAGRKARYAALLTGALEPGGEPAPLRALLSDVRRLLDVSSA